MNLATAKSLNRSKEIGVRKVIGARKKQLIAQFIGESIFISFLAMCLSVIAVFFILPAFNKLTEKHLTLSILDYSSAALILLLTIITGLFAGSYPALFMSSLNPITVLKGKLKLTKHKDGITQIRLSYPLNCIYE